MNLKIQLVVTDLDSPIDRWFGDRYLTLALYFNDLQVTKQEMDQL